ncbi:MAG: hypothetical protein JJU46_02410 [Balneolaceae bacterium]|nr:hypothetical protein [Balneolaceae bacterium]
MYYSRMKTRITTATFALFLIISTLTALTAEGQVPELESVFPADFTAADAENLLTFTENGEVSVQQYRLSNSGSSAVDLYLSFRIMSNNGQLLIEGKQDRNHPFTISAESNSEFSNLDLARGVIPGAEGKSAFSYSLTDEGLRLLRELRGGSVASGKEFVVETTLETSTGDQSVARSSFEAGHPSEWFQIIPDEEANSRLSNIDIRSERPLFAWNAPTGHAYELKVVMTEPDEDPAALLTGNGDLNNDRLVMRRDVEGTRFVVPDNELQNFRQGRDYAWQVSTTVQTTDGEIEMKSAVREFTLNNYLEDEILELLVELMGEQRVQRMLDNGMQLRTITLDGVEYRAEEAVEILRNMVQKINSNRAAIGE